MQKMVCTQKIKAIANTVMLDMTNKGTVLYQ